MNKSQLSLLMIILWYVLDVHAFREKRDLGHIGGFIPDIKLDKSEIRRLVEKLTIHVTTKHPTQNKRVTPTVNPDEDPYLLVDCLEYIMEMINKSWKKEE